MKSGWSRLAIGIVFICGLSACGSGGSPTGGTGSTGGGGNSGSGNNGGGTIEPPIVTDLNILTAAELAAYSVFLDDFAQVSADAVLGGHTDFGTQPVSGAVGYAGYMQIIMGNASVSANVIGDATMQVNLATEAITGSATGFIGVARDEFGTNRAAHYEGTVNITNGTVTDNATGMDNLGFDIGGTLDNGLNRFDVSGNLVGTLYGSNAEGLYAIGSYTGVHGDMDVTIDGLDTPNDIAIATVSALKD